jgi:hypothetical protein
MLPPLAPLQLDFYECDRMIRGIHDVMPNAGWARIRLTMLKLNLARRRAIVKTQAPCCDHNHNIGIAMFVPARDCAGREIPTRDAVLRIVLLHGRAGWDITLKGHEKNSE